MNAVASSLIKGVLAVKPLASFAKNRARAMMMNRAEALGVYWRDEVKALQTRAEKPSGTEPARGPIKDQVVPAWEESLRAIANPHIAYPPYYTTSFHAYDEGNLGWLPAMEADVASRAVHAQIWSGEDARAGVQGDLGLRASYHEVLKSVLPAAPQQIVNLGCSTGRSSLTLQATFPNAQITGVELSPYFLAVGQYLEAKRERAQTAKAQEKEGDQEPAQRGEIQLAEVRSPIHWVHAAAESTGLPADSADLVSACLVFHELPRSAAYDIAAEAYRLVRPGGYFAVMDMNPQSEAYSSLPPYVLTLLKSTEPYLEQYFDLDVHDLFQSVGFDAPQMQVNSPRHRTVIGKKPIQA